MKVVRIVLGTIGGLLMLYGAVRLGHGLPAETLLRLGVWLAGAVIIVFALLLPLVVAVGVLLRRWVPDRVRGYLQGGLIAAGLVVIIAIPLLLRQGTQPAAKAMLLRDYRLSVLVLLVLIVVGALIAYLIRRTPTPRRS